MPQPPRRSTIDILPLIHRIRSQIVRWEATVDLMEAGKMTVSEERNGQKVDITLETIAERRGNIADFEKLIADLQAQSAKRPD